MKTYIHSQLIVAFGKCHAYNISTKPRCAILIFANQNSLENAQLPALSSAIQEIQLSFDCCRYRGHGKHHATTEQHMYDLHQHEEEKLYADEFL